MDSNNFAEMFEKSLTKLDRFTPGQSITTEIIAITKDTIFLQLSGKSEGILDAAELTDETGKISVTVGDTITAYFLSAKNGELWFTTRISGETANKEMLENAWRNSIPVEGVVEKETKGGFEIKIGSTRAFCPFSMMGSRHSENAGSPVGKHLPFKIIEFKENGRNILVSNRAIHEEERIEAIENLQKSLTVGMKITGTITELQKFGAFVDIGGFRALLPISEISLARVENISTVLTVGETIEAELLEIDWKNERVSLSMKALEEDPWETARKKYPIDSKHTGKVVRVTDFGAFVSLEPGLDGLLHISELRGDDRSYNIKKSVTLGEDFTVIIKDIDIENKRLSLQQVSSFEQDETAKTYLDTPGEDETYNPFATLLKKKK